MLRWPPVLVARKSCRWAHGVVIRSQCFARCSAFRSRWRFAPRRRAPPTRRRRCASRSASPRRASIPRSRRMRRPTTSSATIFDAMLDYDYLARPVKLVPRALEAMPTVEDGGKAYSVQGPQRASTSRPIRRSRACRRELTAADFAYGIKRILDPDVKSPWLWLLEGKLQGGDEARATATKSGRFDYDAPIAGARGRRPLHAAHPPQRAGPALSVRARAAERGARRRARSSRRTARDIGAHPVGTGPYMLGEYRRSNRIVLVANPTYRESRYEPAGPMPRSVASRRRGAEGQAAAAAVARRDQHHRGRPGALARVPQSRARFPRHPPVEFTEQALDAHGKLQPELARARHRARRAAAAQHVVDLFQHGGPGRRRLHAGKDRAAARDRHGLRQRANAIRVLLQGPRGAGAGTDPARHRGLRPDAQDAGAALRSGAARALLDRFGYKDRDGDGYRETPDGKPLDDRALVGAQLGVASGRRAVEEEHGCDRHPDRVQEGPRAGAAQDGARRARSRCAATAGTPTIPTPRISCSCSTAATSARTTTRASTCRSSTRSTTRRARCPIHPSARRCSTG